MGFAVRERSGHRIAIIRKGGENDDGDRDRVLVVQAYALSGKTRDNVHANQRRWEGVPRNQCSRPGIQASNRNCVVGRDYRRRNRPQHKNIAGSSEGLGVLPAVHNESIRSPRCALTVECAVAES